MIALVLLTVVAALGVAAALGLTADSRDPDYGLGRVLGQPNRSETNSQPPRSPIAFERGSGLRGVRSS